MSDPEIPSVDWLRQDGLPESTVTCRCGERYRSHAKVVAVSAARIVTLTRKACPACGRYMNARRVSDDPEEFVL